MATTASAHGRLCVARTADEGLGVCDKEGSSGYFNSEERTHDRSLRMITDWSMQCVVRLQFTIDQIVHRP